MKKRIFLISALLLLACYIAGPFIAGHYRIGERDGPVIYSAGMHTPLYILAHEASFDGEKPRKSIESALLYNRPLFYGMNPRLKPAAERATLIARLQQEENPFLERISEANQKAELSSRE